MKKPLLLFLVILLSARLWAQYDSIAHHKLGWFDIDMRDDMMQLRDGSILAHVQLFEVDEQGQYIGDYGNRFLKISRHGAIITDSVFIEDNDLNWFLMKRNPFGVDNVFAKLVRDMENNRTDLCIRFFDDDLNFKPEKELWIPFADTLFPPLRDAYMMDNQGNIIARCFLSEGMAFARVGLDGSVKQQAVIPYDTYPPMSGEVSGTRLGLFSENPETYCSYAYDGGSQLRIAVLNSSFGVEADLVPDGAPAGIEYRYQGQDRVLSWDDESFLVACRYSHQQSDENGTVITRYDKRNLNVQGRIFFQTKPQVQYENMNFGCAFPFGLAKTDNGDMYFAYCTQDPSGALLGIGVGQVSVVRMDANFNIIWQRFCLEPIGYTRVGTDLVVLDDGGVAVGGVVVGTPPEVFFLVFDEYGWEVGESCAGIRPYAYWPNPVQGQLSLQYSPDVRPVQAELFDLQGRLVRSQRNALESIDMEGLPAGTYTMRVAMADGKMFSDKVVKE